MYTIYKTPDAHGWKHKPGVTIIGDAAHVMPPNGEGVNIAMKDALELSQAIVKAQEVTDSEPVSLQSSLDSLIIDFEKDMLARAQLVAGETAELLDMMYGSDDGAKNMASFFISVMPPGQ
jgi:2-polyprenyl-6-methoxyphenol hydroxylase-like FAD-dependent oxidoreductase